MKTLGCMIFGLMLALPAAAQETLINGDVDFGGYGAPIVQCTSINKQFGVFVGGGGGLIIDHTIVLGVAGYGLANNVNDASAPASHPYLNVGYGGAYIQYIHRSNDLVHFTGGVLVGGGGVGYRTDLANTAVEQSNSRDSLNDAFFVLEPDVQMEINVTKCFRIGIGAGYRFVSGIELQGISNSDIGGPNARLLFKFGSF
ncbi:MAG TPA: hypothetical protein VHI13_18865 [Candidatus Kapabacteria bacterium]|nr:hypothetical protein [Candidatus Kapabacteria bacterium]